MAVPLSGLCAESCLMIAPHALDFGTVSSSCYSREHTLTVYNTGNRAFGKMVKFFLSQEPDFSAPLSVFVDGTLLEQDGGHGEQRWSCDPIAQAIIFNALAVPEPGSTITVSYSIACL